MKKKILVICGSSIATATMVAVKLKEICKNNGIDVMVMQGRAAEVRAQVNQTKPDVVVANTMVPDNLGVPVINGMPFLTGIKVKEAEESLLKVLKG